MEYVRPATLDEAIEALASPGARGLAGGTDMLVRLGRGEPWPAGLVDLKGLPELRGISPRDGLLRLGAATTITELLESPQLDAFPALHRACRLFAARSVRNRATIGGNLVNASPAADCVPALMIHETVCVTDRRRIPVSDFFRGPGETLLERGEILVALELPLPPEGGKEFFVKLAPRDTMAIAVASLAGFVLQRKGQVVQARFALGAVAPTPIRAHAAEMALGGGPLTIASARDAARLAAEAADPIDDLRATASYRRRMVRRLMEWELGKLKRAGSPI